MKLTHRILAAVLALATCFSLFTVTASAKKFAKKINTNLGVKTQYEYEANNPSWLRQLIVKENMLSVCRISFLSKSFSMIFVSFIGIACFFPDSKNASISISL